VKYRKPLFDKRPRFLYDFAPYSGAFAEAIIKEGRKMAECPVCGAQINPAPNTEKGEIMSCADCGSELEVTGKDSVQEAPQEEEDWGE
jgi:alpha-aminoadipate carrier protein LysW